MTSEERAQYIEGFIENHCKSVMESKGVEYSRGEDDCNSNFKRLAGELGLSPEQVNWVYLKKHLDSIAYAVKEGRFFDGSEPIEERVGDAINYLFILASLIEERRQEHIVSSRSMTATQVQEVYGPANPRSPFPYMGEGDPGPIRTDAGLERGC